MRRVAALVLGVAGLVAVTACTPREVAMWQDWHQTDPAAAEAFAATLPADPPAASPADCYRALFAANGLPVETFARIAWRESGCNAASYVSDSDDEGGGLLGLNLKGALAARWAVWCGLTSRNVTDPAINVRCAAVAYRMLGLAPWR